MFDAVQQFVERAFHSAWIDGHKRRHEVQCPYAGRPYFRFFAPEVTGSRIKTTSIGALTLATRLSAV
jgi:hypothetical protein